LVNVSVSPFTIAHGFTTAEMTVINTVHASYINSRTGKKEHVYSNTISLVLLPVANIRLESNIQTTVTASEQVQLSHRLTNFGNTTDNYQLSLLDTKDDDSDLEALGLYHDANANGKLDANEVEVKQLNNIAPEQITHLLIVGTVPKNVSAGMLITLKLTATSLNKATLGTKFAINIDSLEVSKQKQNREEDPADNKPDQDRFEQNLAITKRASKTKAMMGDVIHYTINIKNQTETPLYKLQVHDLFPQGLTLLEDSIQLDAEKRDNIMRRTASRLIFELGYFEQNKVFTLSYSTRVNATVMANSILNQAYLIANNDTPQRLKSKIASAEVNIDNKGILANQGTIFGKVHFDKRCGYQRTRYNGLLPIGGVHLYLEDGQYAVTDAAGDYTFEDVKAELHVVKIDPLTLPEGLRLKNTDHRQLNDPRSYLLDLKSSHFSRADFVLNCIHTDADADTNADAKTKDKILSAIRTENASLSDTDYLKGLSVKKNLNRLLVTEKPLSPQEKMLISQQVIQTITNQQAKKGAWLWPKKNISNDGRFMAVVRSDVIKPILTVNGKAVIEDQLGEQIANRKARGQVLAWYGIKLKAGKNILEIKGIDGRGKMLSLLKKVFIKPSAGVKIRVKPLNEFLIADGGKSILPIEVTVLDQLGYPAIGDYFLTVAASDGTWVESDLQDMTPGQQVKISNGQGKIHLRSSRQTGKIRISVKADALKGETEIAQIAHLRPLFVTGYLNLSAGTEGTRSGRTKLFMQGKVLEDMHLTFSFDSDKQYDPEHSAFKQELNERFYALKGDASAYGRKTHSRNKLFIRLERQQQNIQYGDYQTETFSTDDLARVRRSLTGVQAKLELGNTKVQAHLAQEQDKHVVEEFRGNGTALNYQLKNKHVIVNSEIVELIIRNSNNKAVVSHSEILTPLTDYTLDFVTGYLSFHRVIPSFDNNLNPISIRVSYNQHAEGTQQTLVGGVNIEHTLSEALTVGATVNIDQSKESGRQIGGATMQYQHKEGSHVSLSIARMRDNKSKALGTAYQIKAHKKWSKDATTEIKIATADAHFNNPAGGISAGRQEIMLTHQQELNKSMQLRADAQHSKLLNNNKQRQSVGATLEKRTGKWLLEGGIRHIENKHNDELDKFNTVKIGAKRSMRVLGHSARLGASYEQDIANSKRHSATLSADVAVSRNTSLYARYKSGKELSQSLDYVGANHSNTLVIGAKNKLTPKLEAYSEYRTQAFSSNSNNRSGESATGLRGVIDIEKGLKVAPTLEVVKVTKGTRLSDSLSASVKVTDTRSANNNKTLRVETRQSKQTDSYAVDAHYVRRLDDVWSAFIGEELRVSKQDNNDINGSHALTLGLAQRQRDDGKHNSLYLYQWKEARNDANSAGQGGNSTTHVLSTQQHYKLNDDIFLSGRVGGKWQKSKNEGQIYHSDAVLMDAKARYGINNRVDIFARAGVIGSEQFKQQQYSTGLGVNVNLDRNLQLGIAYNTRGFKDKDLDPDKQNKEGFFVNLTLKADEDMFAWLNWKKSKKDANANAIDIPTPKATIRYQVENKPKPAPRKYVERVLSGSSYFATGSSKLSIAGKQAIAALADELKRSGLRKMDILVEGHTDSIGSETNNQRLSEHRAESVALYLSRLGLDLMNMDIEGKGEALPIASNKTKAGRATNRRVNILINGIERY